LNAPASDESVTNDNRIKIDIQTLDPLENGGTPILSYSLEVDDGQGGQFKAVFGKDLDSYATSYVQYYGVSRGYLFRARYRVRNVIGWSDYSPIGFILAAIKPDTPPMPKIVSASATSIQIAILPSEYAGGAPIDKYELWRDDGNEGLYQIISGYDGLSSSINLNPVIDADLSLGLIYRFKVRSHNVKGYSEFSPVVSAAYADHPDKPAQPLKILALSSKTSIAVEWPLNTNHHMPGGAVTGYKLFVDDGLNGDFVEIFYGRKVPSMHEYLVQNLTSQRPYRFRVQAENFNGFGPMSDIITHWTCLPPA